MTDNRDLEVAERLGELKALVSTLVTAVADLKQQLGSDHGRLEARIQVLEQWRYKVLGAAAALAYIAQYLPKPAF